ncbi:MAG: PQ-loop domain-containing transporter [Anaerosomatales bacterium]|nr:PQ-loop domain-containing transporter [Anaerosomatales bacterium]
MAGLMDMLQLGGGIILCAGYIPQIRRILVTRSAHDLSLTMWLSVLAGLLLMEVYALNVLLTSGTRALLITNSLSLAFSIGMVSLILMYGTRPAGIGTLLRLRPTARSISPELSLVPVEVERVA